MLVLLSWKRFNTSHVTLYQAKMEALFTNVTRFNTSHVTLYLQNVDYGKMAKGFQYISCYSLSEVVILVGSFLSSFNTSHVTLYRVLIGGAFAIGKRFNTSHVTLYQNVIEIKAKSLEFQYISCYSLSGYHVRKNGDDFVSIHLMLLFIGMVMDSMVPFMPSFNTSHVTLYPSFYRLFFF